MTASAREGEHGRRRTSNGKRKKKGRKQAGAEKEEKCENRVVNNEGTGQFETSGVSGAWEVDRLLVAEESARELQEVEEKGMEFKEPELYRSTKERGSSIVGRSGTTLLPRVRADGQFQPGRKAAKNGGNELRQPAKHRTRDL